MTSFGPEYSKIQTIWKRDDRGKVVIGDYSLPVGRPRVELFTRKGERLLVKDEGQGPPRRKARIGRTGFN